MLRSRDRIRFAGHTCGRVSEQRDDTRDIDDPARLADEARAHIDEMAADVRAATVPIETEPPTLYRP